MTGIPQELQQHWTAVSPLLSIRNEQEYDLAVERLNRLLDEVGTDEQHPLYTLLDTLGTLIHAYEEEHHPIPECSWSRRAPFSDGRAWLDPIGRARNRIAGRRLGNSPGQARAEYPADSCPGEAVPGVASSVHLGCFLGTPRRTKHWS